MPRGAGVRTKTPHHHAAPAQAWDDALYAKRKPEIISEVDGKFCCLVEWVEQPLPPTEKAIRDTIRKAGPTLPKAIIDAVPKEDPSETGKLDILAFAGSDPVSLQDLVPKGSK